MQLLIEIVKEKAKEAIVRVFPEEESFQVEVTLCQNENFGHYQCNDALKLAKKKGKSPREIAEKIRPFLEDKNLFSKVEIAGPGFINFTFNPYFLGEKADWMLKAENLGVAKPKTVQKIIVEFSSPNIAKELHVGHLRSTIIGECLARLFAFLGHTVLRLNHVGDWGTQFGMLIAYVKEKKPEIISEEKKCTLADLMHFYRDAKKEFDQDEAFKKRAHKEVVALQNKETSSIQVWEKFCQISREAFHKIYDLLEVSIEERGESFYHELLPKIVEDLEKKGLITVSDGAKCVFLEGFVSKEKKPLPLIVQKTDGGFNYATTDLAALKHRIFVEKADRVILVVDQGQSLHFEMVFEVAKKAGFLDPQKTRVDHVGFGVVLGSDGKKLKTRSGETIKLMDLLEEGIRHAETILEEKAFDMDEKEKKILAKRLAISAIKYADLASHRQKDYTFSYDRMLQFEGNTAVFLLYSYVRVQGIKRKIKLDPTSFYKTKEISLKHPSEISLGLHLLRFSEVLFQFAEDLLPHRLTDYLYNLAEKFNAFFRDCRVEGVEEEKERLLLCELVGKTLEKGLYLLGIKVVDRM